MGNLKNTNRLGLVQLCLFNGQFNFIEDVLLDGCVLIELINHTRSI